MVHTDKEDVECGLCETSWSREDDIQEEFITERWSCEANFCTSCVVCEDNLYFSGLYQSQVGCNAVTASQGRLWHHLANQRISPPLRSNLPVLLILHQVLLTRKRLTEQKAHMAMFVEDDGFTSFSISYAIRMCLW